MAVPGSATGSRSSKSSRYIRRTIFGLSSDLGICPSRGTGGIVCKAPAGSAGRSSPTVDPRRAGRVQCRHGVQRHEQQHRVRAARLQPPRARRPGHGRDRGLVRGHPRHEAREDPRAARRLGPALLPGHGQRGGRDRLLLLPERARGRQGRVAAEPLRHDRHRHDEPPRLRRRPGQVRRVPPEAHRQGRRGHDGDQPLRLPRRRPQGALRPGDRRRRRVRALRSTSPIPTAPGSSSRAGRRPSTRATSSTRRRRCAHPSKPDPVAPSRRRRTACPGSGAPPPRRGSTPVARPARTRGAPPRSCR